MTELLIDIGNLHCKYAYLEDRHIKMCGAFAANHPREVSKIARKYAATMPVTSYMISVASHSTNQAISTAVTRYLGHTPILLDKNMPLCGLSSDYRNEQLGIDRVVVMIAAWQRIQQACIVIDCGTAVTVDLIDNSGLHKGGVILPSDELMRLGLSRGTARLNYYEEKNDAIDILATDTETAVSCGCRLTLLASVSTIVQAMSERFTSDIPVLATGGGSYFLENTTAYRNANIRLIKNLSIIPTLNFEGMIELIKAYT